MVLVGVTGQTGSGKTTLCQIFEEIGAKIIDADRIGHQLHEQSEIKDQMMDVFGDEILDDDGDVSRSKIAKIVFSNKERLEQLDDIVSKPLQDKIIADIYMIREDGFPGIVALDAALLPKWKRIVKLCNHIILIDAPRWQRINRLEERFGISSEEAELRIDTLEKLYDNFYPYINYNIKNSGNITEYRAKVVKVWLDIKAQMRR